MNVREVVERLQAEAEAACDEDLAEVLRAAVRMLSSGSGGTLCKVCQARQATSASGGLCKNCYQRQWRRARYDRLPCIKRPTARGKTDAALAAAKETV